MASLPQTDLSLLVRTDFTDDGAWEQVRDEALATNDDGFQAYVEPVSDPTFAAADWQAVRVAVRALDHSASVLFIADRTTLGSIEHPILVVSLREPDDPAPFRVLPSELWGIDNNLNIANMDWQDFAEAADGDGVFRGFTV